MHQKGEQPKMDKRWQISMLPFNTLAAVAGLVALLALLAAANAFGYDSANSCNPNGKLSRRGRAQMLAAIPCDFSKQDYCNLPGAAYPWHAVRRFVHENQGLMKRMYGEMRHISVLRNEMLNNEIDVDDIEMATVRYSRKAGGYLRRESKYLNQRGVNSDFRSTSGGDAAVGNVEGGSYRDQPHFRPVTTTASTTTAKTATTGKASSMTTPSPSPTPITGHSPLSTEAPGLNVEAADKTQSQEPATENPLGPKPDNGNSTQSDDVKISTIDGDGNLESNSVYEIATLLAEELGKNGGNIQIIESPKLSTLGALQNVSQLPTISAVLMANPTPQSTESVAALNTTSSTAPRPKPSTPQTATTSTTARPLTTHRRRYPQHQAQQPAYRPNHHNQPANQFHYQQLQKINNNFREHPTFRPNVKDNAKDATTSSPTPAPPASSASSPVKSTTTSTTTTTAAPSSAAKGDSSGFDLRHDSPDNRQNNILVKPPAAAFATSTTTSPPPTAPTLWSSKPTNAESPVADKLRKQPVAASSSSAATPAPTPLANAATKPILRDGQLYQDTVKQEPTPPVNMRGVNACPVKEEVVAPFWANNTRGEVLALLNLYPFEQYVHWEKCTHEHKQMYCRDGCRCEQQYRLHRLLAYDPKNECRGIFSDWFRFPSCCICKCYYNIPMEFRATSRSPRMESFSFDEDARNPQRTMDESPKRHPIELAEEQVKRAIYEHASDDWYRPQEDYVFDEDIDEESGFY